jgi:hypothetical protein
MYRDGWTPKEADNGTVGKITGAAFAEAAQVIHSGATDYLARGLRLFDRLIEHHVQYGVSFNTDLAKVRKELASSFDKYAEANPFKQWQVKAVELPLKDYGNCRLDVLGVDPEGYWAIADNKYKRTLDLEKYLTKTVNDYRDSWQFQHYPWAYNDWVIKNQPSFGVHGTGIIEEPQVLEQVTRMYLVLVIAAPFKVLTYPFFTNPKLQIRWLRSAQQKWADITAIESGEREPTMSTTHRDGYGYCSMKKACLEMDLDPDLMQFDYVKVPRLPEEVAIGSNKG